MLENEEQLIYKSVIRETFSHSAKSGGHWRMEKLKSTVALKYEEWSGVESKVNSVYKSDRSTVCNLVEMSSVVDYSVNLC